MAITDRAAHVRALIADALEKVSFGQDFSFDISCDLIPAAGRIAVSYTIVTSMSSPLLGKPPMFTINEVQSVMPTADEVQETMAAAVRVLRDAAAKALAGGNGHAARALGGHTG